MSSVTDKINELLNPKEASYPVLDQLEHFYDSLGMMRGGFAPYMRMLFTGSLAGVIQQGIKPSYAFDEYGNPRPFKLTSASDKSTWVPWWMIPSVLGVASGVFI
jgi:hypothetical protein